MRKLLLASGNPGKLREMQSILKDFKIELVTPSKIGIHLEVAEDGETYAENSSKKARAFALAAGLISLADDSGLEVNALNGQPGLHSHRFSHLADGTDADRRAYLLELLQEKPRPWEAHFHCTVALATPTGEIRLADGDCSGEIIPEERGENGFGYDPIFLIPELDRTMAELTLEEKNQLSHRARAVRSAVPDLLMLLRE